MQGEGSDSKFPSQRSPQTPYVRLAVRTSKSGAGPHPKGRRRQRPPGEGASSVGRSRFRAPTSLPVLKAASSPTQPAKCGRSSRLRSAPRQPLCPAARSRPEPSARGERSQQRIPPQGCDSGAPEAPRKYLRGEPERSA
ncbi:hypothetical protein NDU88_001257 [Pleurodeles waltl]|uniref:Uncharacterized protein n=1 Tax=Pleurodeles waltl TaxID=8319 RepID=A0AAV7LFD8_PLEWA|nr:hypothetical protein NDU88_001257 [Pleurodeles waltl]